MAKLVDLISQTIHDASNTLIDSQVTTKASDTVTTLVTAGFDVMEQILSIVNDMTAPDEGPSSEEDSIMYCAPTVTYSPTCPHCACGYGTSSPHTGGHMTWMPALYLPAPAPCGCSRQSMSLPQSLDADPTATPEDALVGGRSDVHLSLEFLVEAGNGPTAEVTVTITSDGTTSTLTENAIAEGYHVKSDFITVKPGSKVTLGVTDAIARVRWCETICC